PECQDGASPRDHMAQRRDPARHRPIRRTRGAPKRLTIEPRTARRPTIVRSYVTATNGRCTWYARSRPNPAVICSHAALGRLAPRNANPWHDQGFQLVTPAGFEPALPP